MAPQVRPDLLRRLVAANDAYHAGRILEASGLLGSILREAPGYADAHHLRGLCLIDMGDFDAAEDALRVALGLNKRNPALLATLGDLLRRPTRFADAERNYRAALAIDRRHVGAVVGLSRLLLLLDRAPEVSSLTLPIVIGAQAPIPVLEVHAEALKQLGRFDEALETARRAQVRGSRSAALEVSNLLRELGRFEEAHRAAEACADMPGNPAALFATGRALQDLGRHVEAEAAYLETLRHDPLNDIVHEHLAVLRLGRTNDEPYAMDILDGVLRQEPAPRLVAAKARLLVRGGRVQDAYALLAHAARRLPGDASLHAAAAKTALLTPDLDDTNARLALDHAQHAERLFPDGPRIAALLGEACLATGDPERTSAIAARLLRRWWDNPALIALQAVAWRMLDDSRYRELYDYDRLVGVFTIDTPKGWANLPSYLSDLAAVLEHCHDIPLDAFGMSRRDGSQTRKNLTTDGEVIPAFHRALEGPVREYLSRLGKGDDPLRRRNNGRYRTKATWSVKTDPQGFQGTHLHPEGWLSSAFYVELPPAIEQDGRQGWLTFGEPGIPTRPRLGADHYVKPSPGRFVLFPSYMWHGTLLYSGPGTRLIMSADFVPEWRI